MNYHNERWDEVARALMNVAMSDDKSPQQEVEAAIEMVYEILWRFEINAKRSMTAEEFKARIPKIIRACDPDVTLSAEMMNLEFAVGR